MPLDARAATWARVHPPQRVFVAVVAPCHVPLQARVPMAAAAPMAVAVRPAAVPIAVEVVPLAAPLAPIAAAPPVAVAVVEAVVAEAMADHRVVADIVADNSQAFTYTRINQC